MPNPGAMVSLQAFERESVNTVIHVPDYRLRQHLSIQHQEPVVVEAFVAFDEMFFLQLRWLEGGNYPEVQLSVRAAQQYQLVFDLCVQSSHFTHSTGDGVYSVAAPQWVSCTWSTPVIPVTVRRPGDSVIPLNVDRPPTYHNDINVSLEQTVTFTVMGMIWQMDGAPMASLQCASYLAKQSAPELPPKEVTASMVARLSEARAAPDIAPDVRIELEDDEAAGGALEAHAFLLQAQSPVFRRMLAGPMLEAKERNVKIAGVQRAEFADFLKALYDFGVPPEVSEDDERLLSLLALTDRYEVIALRDASAALLQGRLCEANMAALLKVAEMHEASALRIAALEFITATVDRVAVAMENDNPAVRRAIRAHVAAARVAAAAPKLAETTLTV